MTFNPSAVTHRLARKVTRDTTYTEYVEGAEATPTVEKTWECVCACGRVFTGTTDTEVAGKYLDHLPKPKKEA